MDTHEAQVNVPSELHAIWKLLGHTADHKKKQGFLHILVPKDFWSNAACQPVVHISLSSDSLQIQKCLAFQLP